VIDAGFAALATFIVTVYAARILETAVLGYYAVFFTAFLVAIQIPAKLIMIPTEVYAVTLDEVGRVTLLRRSLFRGLVVSAASSLVGAALGVGITVSGGFATPLPFAVTLIAAAIVSTLQDHVRRMLHTAGLSWGAAIVSIVQLIGVAAGLGVLVLLGADPMWIPFTALAFANVVSSATGIWLSIRKSNDLGPSLPPIRSQLRSGSWLLATGLLPPVAGLVVQSIVIALVGPIVLGLAEAARVIGRPILVVSTGLGQALAPRLYSAAKTANRRMARRASSAYLGVFLVGGALYTALVSFDWTLNVALPAVPKAYEVSGLVLAVCLANLLVGIGFPSQHLLIGAGQETWVALIETGGQTARSILATAAGAFGAFVIPLGDAVLGLIRVIGYRMRVPAVYVANQQTDGTSAKALNDGSREEV
jgi:O-antigen/teichoic acid export membrane protein